MDIKYQDNKLTLPFSKISFKYNIAKVIEIKGGVVVMLDIPNNSDEVNNIYAVDLNGKKIWKVQPVSEFTPNVKYFSPYVGMNLLENGNISATNYFGINYEISVKDGTILNSKMAK